MLGEAARMNPLHRPWGDFLPSVPSVEDPGTALSADEPVSDLEDPGLELAIAQARDRMWRAERRDELRSRLDSTDDLERQGAQVGEFAGPALALGILAGFVAYRFEHAAVAAVGKIACVVAVLAVLAAVVLFPLGWVLRLTARGRRAALLAQARREAIDVDANETQV